MREPAIMSAATYMKFLLHVAGRVLDGLNDVMVSGAAAEVA